MADAAPALLDAVTAVLREAGASFALVFGSRARGDARPDSDLDVAAWWRVVDESAEPHSSERLSRSTTHALADCLGLVAQID